jgi:DNA-binding NarL/FixJ family response regulator
MTRTSVVIADPLTMFRSGVRDVLGSENDFAVVEASNLKELIDAASRTSVDIALIDPFRFEASTTAKSFSLFLATHDSLELRPGSSDRRPARSARAQAAI